MILLKIDVRKFLDGKVSKGATIRNRYNQSLHTYLLCEFSGGRDNTTRATYIGDFSGGPLLDSRTKQQ